MNPLERDLRVTPLVLWSCKSREGVSTSASATKCKVQAIKMHGYLFKLFNVYQHGDIIASPPLTMGIPAQTNVWADMPAHG